MHLYIFHLFSVSALCLIEDMLTFNPVHRVTAEDALCFPYFKPYHCLAAKNIAPVPFRIESEVSYWISKIT